MTKPKVIRLARPEGATPFTPVHCVTPDWQMPKMSGPELCRQIRKRPEISGFPILALTAKALELDEVEVAELGIRQVLNKPFSPRELLAHVQHVLGIATA